MTSVLAGTEPADVHAVSEMTGVAIGPGDPLVLSCGPGQISMVEALADLLTNRVRHRRSESVEDLRSRPTNLE